jgi:hypothetical protein
MSFSPEVVVSICVGSPVINTIMIIFISYLLFQLLRVSLLSEAQISINRKIKWATG